MQLSEPYIERLGNQNQAYEIIRLVSAGRQREPGDTPGPPLHIFNYAFRFQSARPVCRSGGQLRPFSKGYPYVFQPWCRNACTVSPTGVRHPLGNPAGTAGVPGPGPGRSLPYPGLGRDAPACRGTAGTVGRNAADYACSTSALTRQLWSHASFA